MRTEVTIGQYLDVLTQAAGDTTRERASLVARFKSAKYTVEHPLLLGAPLGAPLAAAGSELTNAYSEYGLPLGEAFQLRDDVLGMFGDPARTGKPAGGDLREGKRTYLIAAAFEAADPAAAKELAAGLGDPDLDAAGIARLQAIVTETGALARTEQRIATLTATALEALAAAAPGTGFRERPVSSGFNPVESATQPGRGRLPEFQRRQVGRPTERPTTTGRG